LLILFAERNKIFAILNNFFSSASPYFQTFDSVASLVVEL
jgi:hypothetical protein